MKIQSNLHIIHIFVDMSTINMQQTQTQWPSWSMNNTMNNTIHSFIFSLLQSIIAALLKSFNQSCGWGQLHWMLVEGRKQATLFPSNWLSSPGCVFFCLCSSKHDNWISFHLIMFWYCYEDPRWILISSLVQSKDNNDNVITSFVCNHVIRLIYGKLCLTSSKYTTFNVLWLTFGRVCSPMNCINDLEQILSIFSHHVYISSVSSWPDHYGIG